jgi:hypothetical protein
MLKGANPRDNEIRKAVDHPSKMTPLAPSIAPRTRQLLDNVRSP